MTHRRRDTVVHLKDGSDVGIGTCCEEDLKKIVEMYSSFSDEALRWTRPPYTEETIKRLSKDENLILLAKHENRIVGHCMLDVHQHSTEKGIASLIINIHQDFQNKGLGTVMVKTIVDRARREGVHRIELGVVAEHEMAIHVYEKLGFRTEGILREAYYGVDEKYHDKLIMGLLL